jgi:hypothetical protein
MNVKKIWQDPVWSKVIATGIAAGIGLVASLVISWIKSISTGKTFKEQFISFWTYKVELWVFALILVLLLVIFLFYYFSTKVYVREESLNPVKGIPLSSGLPPLEVSNLLKNSSAGKVLFDSSKADKSWFFGYKEFSYKDDKAVGNKADGTSNFNNQILEIERQNREGRYVIKLLKYIGNNEITNFIAKDPIRTSYRIIRIYFSVKVIDGSHSIYFISKKPNEDRWIDSANTYQIIHNQNWQEFNLQFRISQNLDFELYIHDFDVTNAPSRIQIKNLVIEEDH